MRLKGGDSLPHGCGVEFQCVFADADAAQGDFSLGQILFGLGQFLFKKLPALLCFGYRQATGQ